MKKLRKIWAIVVVGLICWLVAGCSPETPNWKLKQAESFCADRDGISHINNIFGGGVVCGNGEDGLFDDLRGN